MFLKIQKRTICAKICLGSEIMKNIFRVELDQMSRIQLQVYTIEMSFTKKSDMVMLNFRFFYVVAGNVFLMESTPPNSLVKRAESGVQILARSKNETENNI